MIQQRKPSIVTISHLRRHRSFDKKHKHSSIKKQRSNTIIHVALGLSRDIYATNTKKILHEQIPARINNHQYQEKETKSAIIQNPIQYEKRFIHSNNDINIHQYYRSLSQIKKSANVTKQSSSQLNNSTKTQTDQDSNINRSSKIKSRLLRSFKVFPREDVSIGHTWLDGKGMTEDYHRQHKTNKKTKLLLCSRRCILLSLLTTLLVVLIIITILLILLIKPKSETTRTDIPVLRWNSTCITVAGITNNPGNADNQLNDPIDITLDYEHNLYIADYNNHRIQKYLFGVLTGQTVAGNGTSGSSQYQLHFPLRVIVDSNENLYISDGSNARVQYWSKGAVSGTTLAGKTGKTKIIIDIFF
ncbi:unnamed protein product [Rotaria sordida]|uniref:NHL repeat-containing protein n=1 Tax=Rotaria sordida TaxID=392033 RepID=A0A815C1T1_9BILA|nr:unnamed protein product [Rotaria sordida]CAF1557415.1 unnamed protein product [Rotaria sordida]